MIILRTKCTFESQFSVTFAEIKIVKKHAKLHLWTKVTVPQTKILYKNHLCSLKYFVNKFISEESPVAKRRKTVIIKVIFCNKTDFMEV